MMKFTIIDPGYVLWLRLIINFNIISKIYILNFCLKLV